MASNLDAVTRLQNALDAIDAANREDPTRVLADGVEHPKELLYSQRMSAALAVFAPDASEALRLAARAQHIRRWTLPRDRYPMDRAGYHRWRTTLYQLHADMAAELLEEVGYDAATIARVRLLIRKEKLKSDVETQTLEDVICLVFLEHYFDEFAAQHPRDKVIAIVQKTWRKMSEPGHEAALKLPMTASASSLISAALNPSA